MVFDQDTNIYTYVYVVHVYSRCCIPGVVHVHVCMYSVQLYIFTCIPQIHTRYPTRLKTATRASFKLTRAAIIKL